MRGTQFSQLFGHLLGVFDHLDVIGWIIRVRPPDKISEDLPRLRPGSQSGLGDVIFLVEAVLFHVRVPLPVHLVVQYDFIICDKQLHARRRIDAHVVYLILAIDYWESWVTSDFGFNILGYIM